MATTAQLTTWLAEAESALHKLNTGSLVEEIAAPDGGRMRYMQTSKPALEAYVASLKSQVAATSPGSAAARGPIYFSNTFE